MNITQHAKCRMTRRGINQKFVDYALFFLPSTYDRQSNKIFLSKKAAKKATKKIRKFADILEKHAGTELLFDPKGKDLITAYRKTVRK